MKNCEMMSELEKDEEERERTLLREREGRRSCVYGEEKRNKERKG